MKIIIKSFVILVIIFIGKLFGQTNQKYFYYYKNQKYYLQLDKSKISISSHNETNDKLNLSSKIVEDYTRKTLITTDNKAIINKNIRTYYYEINVENKRSNEEYFAEVKKLKNDQSILIASPNFTTTEGQKLGLSNNFYVKLKSKNDIELLYKSAEDNKIEVLGHNEYMPLWFTLSCGKNSLLPNALEAANSFYETGLFESTEPAFIYHDLELSADPLFNQQWGLKNTGQYGNAYAGIDINAEQAWTISKGANIKTAIFDHGFEMNHPDLAANVYGNGFDAQTNTSPSIVRGEHGTACAGIIGARQNNNIGISGIAPETKLVSISINLEFSDTPQQLANGFNWASNNNVDIISNSWGGYAPSSIIDNAISNALTYGRNGKGMVIVFAAGNEDDTNIRYPGNSNPKILVVGAMSPCGERKNPESCDGEYWGSCYGSELDIIAPGVKIATTDRQGSNGYSSTDYYLTFNGTSSACPAVAGVAALILSKNPELTNLQVNDIIEKSARKIRTDLYNYSANSNRPNGSWNIEMGYGLIDAYQALLFTSATSCPDNLDVTTNVTNTDYKQASNIITASNTIFSGATATYHAANQVILSNGFNAKNGSSFNAYIEGCKIGKTNNIEVPEKIVYNPVTLKGSQIENGIQYYNELSVIPNPASNYININTGKEKLISWQLYDVSGKLMKNGNSNTINIQSIPNANYVLKINLEKTQISKTIIVKH